MSWAVVVPSNRPDRLVEFLAAWQPIFSRHGVELFVVRDEPETWATLPDWVPRRTDMIRSWGFLQAYQTDADYVLTLDDDVRPLAGQNGSDIFDQYERVFESGAPLSDYVDVGALTSAGVQMRGFPYVDREPATVAVQYGGWFGVMDYDARTQLAGVPGSATFSNVVLPVPRGAAATCCIMNCAFRREVTPIMWQLPLVEGRYNRWGDIWSGLIQKRVLDAIGQVMVINGRAPVLHKRASDPLANLERETPGIPFNEGMWQALAGNYGVTMNGAWSGVVERMAAIFDDADPEYAEAFRLAAVNWVSHLQPAVVYA